MSFKKFEPKDILLNTMKAHPSCEFFIFDGKLYHNNVPERSGAFSNQVLNVPAGYVNLYGYNIDKLSGSNNFIYPFIYKNSDRESFRSITTTTAATDYAYGDLMTSNILW